MEREDTGDAFLRIVFYSEEVYLVLDKNRVPLLLKDEDESRVAAVFSSREKADTMIAHLKQDGKLFVESIPFGEFVYVFSRFCACNRFYIGLDWDPHRYGTVMDGDSLRIEFDRFIPREKYLDWRAKGEAPGEPEGDAP